MKTVCYPVNVSSFLVHKSLIVSLLPSLGLPIKCRRGVGIVVIDILIFYMVLSFSKSGNVDNDVLLKCFAISL